MLKSGCDSAFSIASVTLVSFLVIVRRGGIQLPAVLVAFGDLVRALELLVVLVGHAERLADVVDAVLVGGRIVAPRGFVAHRVGFLPVGIDVAAGDRRTRFVVIVDRVLEVLPARAGGRRAAIEIQAGRRSRNGLLDLTELLAAAVQARGHARAACARCGSG